MREVSCGAWDGDGGCLVHGDPSPPRLPHPGGPPWGLTLHVPPPADPQRESKENQWLGVSVKSQGAGGKIVVSTVAVAVGGDGWW